MKPAKLPPVFQQVFFTVVCLTLLSGGGSLWLSSKGNLSPEQTRVFETCNTTWNMGIGAIFGLLGSKAADLFEEDKNDE
ncbi:MAG: hypothetical protein ACKO7W_23420 [Elainella sp.]